jgi:hypothetical protein
VVRLGNINTTIAVIIISGPVEEGIPTAVFGRAIYGPAPLDPDPRLNGRGHLVAICPIHPPRDYLFVIPTLFLLEKIFPFEFMHVPRANTYRWSLIDLSQL